MWLIEGTKNMLGTSKFQQTYIFHIEYTYHSVKPSA